ncbi:hypothetical protein O0I10_009028 [Lichtheimia ornata]|uniref:RBR-type E3 ubiquitin transferase n=1 Tax=Lichtheimia ornata TaxID=688661 RepID=A0AAD7XSI6_9FUNG|nr:uncharacterized protein O0I10_009028 [Lichtheimia ornata]KAJ8655339.1 hypothetical protein O0I10_009028 [Lichtheimia ornata]
MITRSITQASSSSSGGDTATCCICLDKHRKQETFKPEDCNDVVCQACLATYLNTQLDIPQESYERIACPRQSCTGTFSAIAIVPLVLTSPNSAHYWWRKVIENTVMDSVGYCPYPDCHASFELFPEGEDDEDDHHVYAKCFDCSRGICLRCETPWHSGITCKDNEEDNRGPRWKRPGGEKRRRRKERENSIQARQLAKRNSWTRCPFCKEMVEKKEGCSTVTCTCKREFCYRCGSPSWNHQCSRSCHNLSQAELSNIRETMYQYEDIPVR